MPDLHLRPAKERSSFGLPHYKNIRYSLNRDFFIRLLFEGNKNRAGFLIVDKYGIFGGRGNHNADSLYSSGSQNNYLVNRGLSRESTVLSHACNTVPAYADIPALNKYDLCLIKIK